MSTSFDVTAWFVGRGLRVLPYQQTIIEKKIPRSLKTSDKQTALAASLSSSKTIMSIYSIDKYISEHPGARVLVLAHGTTVLRSQYYKEIVDLKPAFTYSLIENKADTINNNTQVWAALPQAIQKLKLVRLTCW